MVKKTKSYALEPANKGAHSKARANNVRVHFKLACETANVLRGMKLARAKKFLNNVLRHTEAVPIRKFRNGRGRHPQAKQWGVAQCGWPVKATYAMLKLLRNAEANAVTKKLDVKKTLSITYSSK